MLARGTTPEIRWSRMRIAFDGTTLRPQQTGIGYYTEHLLQHLILAGKDEEWVVVSNRDIRPSLPLPETVKVFDRYRFPIRNIWMQMLAPLTLRKVRPHVAHFTNAIAPLVKTVP